MHLPLEDFVAHVEYVAGALKSGGYYIFSTLNPKYELVKSGQNLQNGDRYDFKHGKDGEYGTFYHYYKTSEFINETLEKYLSNYDKNIQTCNDIILKLM